MPLPFFVLVVSNNSFKEKLKTYQHAVDQGKFGPRSLEVYNRSITEGAEFKARFGASSPAHGFNVDTLYRLLEAKRRYVRACDYDDDYEMSRLQEATNS